MVAGDGLRRRKALVPWLRSVAPELPPQPGGHLGTARGYDYPRMGMFAPVIALGLPSGNVRGLVRPL